MENSIKQADYLITGVNKNGMVTPSTETRSWLEHIISGVAEQITQLEYVESKYWGAFENPATHRNIVCLQPTKKQIPLHSLVTPDF